MSTTRDAVVRGVIATVLFLSVIYFSVQKYRTELIALPLFTARAIDGRVVDSASFAGKIILLNYWATWCAPCLREMPELERLQQVFKDDLVIIGILQEPSTSGEVERILLERRISYPTVASGTTLDLSLPKVVALPSTLIFDRRGNFVSRRVGIIDADVIETEIRSLQSGR
jgi:thiol-disulfide isomerase/thioredoxin